MKRRFIFSLVALFTLLATPVFAEWELHEMVADRMTGETNVFTTSPMAYAEDRQGDRETEVAAALGVKANNVALISMVGTTVDLSEFTQAPGGEWDYTARCVWDGNESDTILISVEASEGGLMYLFDPATLTYRPIIDKIKKHRSLLVEVPIHWSNSGPAYFSFDLIGGRVKIDQVLATGGN